MKVRFSKRARADLVEIADYISRDNLVAAGRVRGAILHAIDLLSRQPNIGMRNERSPTLRSKLAVPFPYRIHYRTKGDTLWIIHIRHTSRREWRGK